MRLIHALALMPLAACTSLAGLSASDPPSGDDAGDSGNGVPDSSIPPTPPGNDAASDTATPDGGCSGASCGPACDGGLTSCSGACVDTRVDKLNCGACGHSCLGATCTAGKCDPVTLTTTLALPSAVRGVGQNLYVLRTGGIDRVPKAGGAPVSLVTPGTLSGVVSLPYALAVDPNYAYFFAAGGAATTVFRCALGGCFTIPQALVPTGISNPLAIDVDATTLAWGATYQEIKSCASASCTAASTLAPSEEGRTQISLTKGYVVWANEFNRAVYRCERVGCTAPTELAGSNVLASPPGPLVVYGDTAYFATSASIYSCAVAGCGGAPTAIAQMPGVASAIAADASGVYWTVPAAGNAGVVASCGAGKTCGATPVLVASARANPVSLALDDTAVYWVEADGANNKGSAFKLAK